jgi:hypothetical protein
VRSCLWGEPEAAQLGEVVELTPRREVGAVIDEQAQVWHKAGVVCVQPRTTAPAWVQRGASPTGLRYSGTRRAQKGTPNVNEA